MSGPIGRDNRRLNVLERELAVLRSQIDTLQARLAIDRPPQAWRFGVTAKLLDESTYPTEGSGADTFGVRFADLEFSPVAAGDTNLVKHYRSAKAKVPAHSLSGYIAEGTPVVAFWSAVPGAATNAGCWFICLAGTPPASGNSALMLFAVGATPLTRATAELTDAICVWAEGGGTLPEPDEEVTVKNLESNVTSTYWYAAASGQYGLAAKVADDWRIIRTEPVKQTGAVVDVNDDGMDMSQDKKDLWLDITENPTTEGINEGTEC